MEMDFDTIEKALDLTVQGTRAADSGLALINRFKELFKTSKPDERKGEIDQLILEMMSQLADAKMVNVNLKEQLVSLRENALEMHRKQEDFERYYLRETSAGSRVLTLKNDQVSEERPAHSICPRCREDGFKSVLQGGGHYLRCDRCSSNYTETRPAPPKAVRKRFV